MSDFPVLLVISHSPFESMNSVVRLPVELILLLERLILGISRNTTLLGRDEDEDYLRAVAGNECVCSILVDPMADDRLQNLVVIFVHGLLGMLRLFAAKVIVESSQDGADSIVLISLVGDCLETWLFLDRGFETWLLLYDDLEIGQILLLVEIVLICLRW